MCKEKTIAIVPVVSGIVHAKSFLFFWEYFLFKIESFMISTDLLAFFFFFLGGPFREFPRGRIIESRPGSKEWRERRKPARAISLPTAGQ